MTNPSFKKKKALVKTKDFNIIILKARWSQMKYLVVNQKGYETICYLPFNLKVISFNVAYLISFLQKVL